MNLFFLSRSPKRSAKYACDKHVVKIILEVCQMLFTAHHIVGNFNIPHNVMNPTHVNHPMSKWVRQHENNYKYTVQYLDALCSEYTRRYQRTHSMAKHISWLKNHVVIDENVNIDKTSFSGTFLAMKNIPSGCTPVPLCMPDIYKCDDLIQSYRQYYIGDKKYFAKWTISGQTSKHRIMENPPYWFILDI